MFLKPPLKGWPKKYQVQPSKLFRMDETLSKCFLMAIITLTLQVSPAGFDFDLISTARVALFLGFQVRGEIRSAELWLLHFQVSLKRFTVAVHIASIILVLDTEKLGWKARRRENKANHLTSSSSNSSCDQ